MYLWFYKFKKLPHSSPIFQFVISVGVLFTFSVFAYRNSFTNQFMLDDFLVIFGPQGLINKNFLQLFSNYQVDFYRPVGHIFLWLFSHWFGSNVAPYHIASLLLLYLTGFLFYKIIFLLTDDYQPALLASILYCSHPIHGIFVNYITASNLITFVLALQMSLLLIIKFIQSKRSILFYIFSLVFFALALFSHEISLIFPVMIICLLYFYFQYPVRSCLFLAAPYFLVLFLYLLIRFLFFSHLVTVKAVAAMVPHFDTYLATYVDLISWYVSKLFWPRGIIFLWTGELARQYILPTLLGCAGFILLSIYFIFIRWRRGVKPFLLSIFILGFIPALVASFTYFPSVGPIIEPHWFSFSVIGFFTLLAIYLLEFKTKNYRRLWICAVTGILVLNLLFLRRQNINWRSQESYCRYWLSKNPKNLTPFYGLGKSLMDRGAYQEAIYYFKKGIQETHIYNALILADLGYAEFLLGHQSNALHYFQEVIQIEPTYPIVYHYLAQFYIRVGQFKKAESFYKKALALDPQNADYKKGLDWITTKNGNTD